MAFGVCRDWTEHVAYCHATIADADNWEDSVSVPIQRYEAEKKYDIELKPLFSAFRPRAIGATTIRALLVNYLPLLEAYLQPEDDDLEEDRDRPPRPPIDPVVPLKRSVTHILREVHLLLSSVIGVSNCNSFCSRPCGFMTVAIEMYSLVLIDASSVKGCRTWLLYLG